MRRMGWCPSGRLFEASACGIPIVSDSWDGLDEFFTPSSEILIAETSEEAIAALQLSDDELSRIGTAARERTLTEHTASRRSEQLEELLVRASEPEALEV
jgi:spore maturation protein CgeB